MRTLHTETVTIDARRVVAITCDFCHGPMPLIPPDLREVGDVHATVLLEHEESRRGEGETETTRVTYDCCGSCWRKLVEPVLQRLVISRPDFVKELIRG